jgi:hypothetical protein
MMALAASNRTTLQQQYNACSTMHAPIEQSLWKGSSALWPTRYTTANIVHYNVKDFDNPKGKVSQCTSSRAQTRQSAICIGSKIIRSKLACLSWCACLPVSEQGGLESSTLAGIPRARLYLTFVPELLLVGRQRIGGDLLRALKYSKRSKDHAMMPMCPSHAYSDSLMIASEASNRLSGVSL